MPSWYNYYYIFHRKYNGDLCENMYKAPITRSKFFKKTLTMSFRSRYLWIVPNFLDIVPSQEAFIIVDLVVGSGQKWSLHDSSITIIYNLSTRLQSELDQWGGGGGGWTRWSYCTTWPGEGVVLLDQRGCWTRWRDFTTVPERVLDLRGCWTRWVDCTTGPEGVLYQMRDCTTGPEGVLDQRGCWTKGGTGPEVLLDKKGCWTKTTRPGEGVVLLDQRECWTRGHRFWTKGGTGPEVLLDKKGCWTKGGAGPDGEALDQQIIEIYFWVP